MSLFVKTIKPGGGVVRTVSESPRVKTRKARTARKGVGDHMADIIGENPFGKILGLIKRGCRGCMNLKRDLNTWGPVRSETNRAQIVARIRENAGLFSQVITDDEINAALTEAIRRHNAGKPNRNRRATSRRARRFRGKVNVGEPREPVPFTKPPHLTLVFHCWPRIGGWEKHIEQLKKVEHRFDRKLMGISVGGPRCSTAEEVKSAFGPSWEYHEFANIPTQGEAPTLRWALSQIPDDPDAVTFYCHSKGTKDNTINSAAVKWWADAMYATVIHNTDDVVDRINRGAVFVGSFRYSGRFFPTHNSWHYSGTFWAFRNCQVLEGRPDVRPKYYGTEAFPSDRVPLAQSDCVFGETNFPTLYDEQKQPRTELEEWKTEQPTPLQTFAERMKAIERPAILRTGAKVWPGSVNPDWTVQAPHAEWITTDIESAPEVDIVADLQALNLPDRFDGILSHSTLEHIPRPWRAVESISEALKPGGVLFLHTHQTFPLHGYPHDYFRCSESALRTMCKDAGLIVLNTQYDRPCAIVPDPEVPVWDATAPAFLDINLTAVKPG